MWGLRPLNAAFPCVSCLSYFCKKEPSIQLLKGIDKQNTQLNSNNSIDKKTLLTL
jgi:hypothetical protein